ncbi:predicted protein [Phaeodactylum tricornutum CCAP 1055/1]|uniref:L-aspartate oxidase n=1 Tax=Phaeodactylum tricornutum (strain CCAP 1055/1) TaxID=556484 RepID=B7GCP4_PHATC|nr:predicted protein [Phaeodactylum tricornutum CCAP 1055/1]EEC43575.1 predicted protein [Phaeodactylum tricornutum CCAP 1055/1]|eukprot:XP_002184839.1 predicted protein [Phaeodactylum tricornutum CCAP 1055/1]
MLSCSRKALPAAAIAASRQQTRTATIITVHNLLYRNTALRRLCANPRAFSTRARSLSSSSAGSSLDKSREDRVLVVGSGVAGSAAALIAAELHNLPVTMLFAGDVPTDCNSYWAQGGIIYRNYDPLAGDSAASLAADIHRAGAGLCDDAAVQKVATQGPSRVRQLLLNDLDNNQRNATSRFANVPFDQTAEGTLSLCLEASHAAPRILHKADHTGAIISQHLAQAVANHPNITLQPNTIVTDLVRDPHGEMCVGVETLQTVGANAIAPVARTELAYRGVVLASGGLAGIYQHSTNPPGFNALGSSVGVAARANVRVQDLEYVQFHPTALYLPDQARFLLTEALRGEGAVLRNADGEAFARRYHDDGELAPRDIVARAVFSEAQNTNDLVYLDITHRDADWVRARFPTIQAHLQNNTSNGSRPLDLATDWLPITPAAHYTCGGVATDLHGRTSLSNLYAAGEAARTGLHGGNRLASTSLLEGLVFGASVADFCGSDEGRELASKAAHRCGPSTESLVRVSQPNSKSSLSDEALAARTLDLLGQVKQTMWDHVGVVRNRTGLKHAVGTLEAIRDEVLTLPLTLRDTAALRDAAFAGHAVAQFAYTNPVSAGAHCVVEAASAVDETGATLDDSDEEDQTAEARF